MKKRRQRLRRGATSGFSLTGIGICALLVMVIGFAAGIFVELPRALREAEETRVFRQNDLIRDHNHLVQSSPESNPAAPAVPPAESLASQDSPGGGNGTPAENMPAATPTEMPASTAVANTADQPPAEPQNVPSAESPQAVANIELPFYEFFNGLTLPPFDDTAPKEAQTLAKLHVPDRVSCNLALMSPPPGINKVRFELEAVGDKSGLPLSIVYFTIQQKKDNEPRRVAIARFSYDHPKLKFEWLKDSTPDSRAGLTNCALDIVTSNKARYVAMLRPVQVIAPIAVKLDKDSYVVPIRSAAWDSEEGEFYLDSFGLEGYSNYSRVFPERGRVRVGVPLQLIFSGGGPAMPVAAMDAANVAIQLTLNVRAGNLELKVEPLIDVGGTKPVPFTRARAERMAKMPAYQYLGSQLPDLVSQLSEVASGINLRVMFVLSKGTETEVFRAGRPDVYGVLGDSLTK